MLFGAIDLHPHKDGYYCVHYAGNGVYMGDILAGDDGYYYWWPNKKDGCLDQTVLQSIATCLGSLNREWDRQIQEYFS
jgi:hypothetical protein